jgi:acyl phosphate:glycerol-3-phosphate acyltransferase
VLRPMSRARLLLAGVVGYALGTIPSADLASRFAARGGDARVDLRSAGSGNPGATNAANVLGTSWGVAVLGADIAKGVTAGFAGRVLAGDSGAYVAANAAVGGHIAPAWNGFRGGKGIATSAGTCLAVFPAYFGADLAVAAIGAAGSRNAERATQLSSVAFVSAALLWTLADLPNAWGPRPSAGLVAFAALTSAMILAKFAAARA